MYIYTPLNFLSNFTGIGMWDGEGEVECGYSEGKKGGEEEEQDNVAPGQHCLVITTLVCVWGF